MAKKKRAAKRGAKQYASDINSQLVLSYLGQIDSLPAFEKHVTPLLNKKKSHLSNLITEYVKHFINLTNSALEIKEAEKKYQALSSAIRLLPQLLDRTQLDNDILLLINAINNYQLQVGANSAQTAFLVCNIKLKPQDKQTDAQNPTQYALSLSQQYIKSYNTYYNELQQAGADSTAIDNTMLFKWLNELTALYKKVKGEFDLNLSDSILSAYHFITKNIMGAAQELVENNLALMPSTLVIYEKFNSNDLSKKFAQHQVNTFILPLFELWDCYAQIHAAPSLSELNQTDAVVTNNVKAFLQDKIENISIAMLIKLFFAKSNQLAAKTEKNTTQFEKTVLIYKKIFITLNYDKSLIPTFMHCIQRIDNPRLLDNKTFIELRKKTIELVKNNTGKLFEDDIEQYYNLIISLTKSQITHKEINKLLLEPFSKYCSNAQNNISERVCSVLLNYIEYLAANNETIYQATIATACKLVAHIICRFMFDRTSQDETVPDIELEQLQHYMTQLGQYTETASSQTLNHYSKLFDGLYSLQQNMGSAYMDLSAAMLSPMDHSLKEICFIAPLASLIQLSIESEDIEDTALLMLVRDSLWLISSSYEKILTEQLMLPPKDKTKITELLNSIANNDFDAINIDSIAQDYSHTFCEIINEIIKALTAYIKLAKLLSRNSEAPDKIKQRVSNYQKFIDTYKNVKEKTKPKTHETNKPPCIKADSLKNIHRISAAVSENEAKTIINILESTIEYLPKNQLTEQESNDLSHILKNICIKYQNQHWMSLDTPKAIINLSASLIKQIKPTNPKCPKHISQACFNLLILPIKALVENNQYPPSNINIYKLELLPLINQSLQSLGYSNYSVDIDENNQYVQNKKTKRQKSKNKKPQKQPEKPKNSPAQPIAKPMAPVVIEQPVPIKPPSPEVVTQLESKVSQHSMFSKQTSPRTMINSQIQDKVQFIEQSLCDLNKNPNKKNIALITHLLSKLLKFAILNNDNFDALSDKQKSTLLMYIDNKLLYLSSILFTCDSETGVSLLNNEHQLLLKKTSHTANIMSDDNWAHLAKLVIDLNHAKQKHPYKSVVTIDTHKIIISYLSKKLFSDNAEHNITPILQECQVLLHKLERADANTKKEHIHFIQNKLDLLITTLFKSGTTIEQITTETFYNNLQKQKSLAQEKWDNPSEQNQLKFACAQTYNTYLRCLHTKTKLPIDKQYPDYWQQLAQMVIAIKTIERQATDTEESSYSMTLTLGM